MLGAMIGAMIGVIIMAIFSYKNDWEQWNDDGQHD